VPEFATLEMNMKRLLIAAGVLAFVTGGAYADNYVNGYYRNDGTYVQPHFRSDPDSSRLNNYSTQGNYNPYTEQQGTVSPYTNPYGSSGTSTYGIYGTERRR
jgi:hypothetical protein